MSPYLISWLIDWQLQKHSSSLLLTCCETCIAVCEWSSGETSRAESSRIDDEAVGSLSIARAKSVSVESLLMINKVHREKVNRVVVMIWYGMECSARQRYYYSLICGFTIVVVGQYDGWILAVCTNGCTISNVRDLLVDGLTVDGSL